MIIWFSNYYYSKGKYHGDDYETEYTRLEVCLLVINFARTTTFGVKIFFLYIEIRNLRKEINDSPYSIIDDKLTEEMYTSIINHSKNPENPIYIDRLSRGKSTKKVENVDYSDNNHSKLESSKINLLS